MSLSRSVMKAPVHLYRATLKPWMGMECRHMPSCSEYALEAIDRNGAWKGFWLMVSRIARCHPWGTHGYDPVPDLTPRKPPLRTLALRPLEKGSITRSRRAAALV